MFWHISRIARKKAVFVASTSGHFDWESLACILERLFLFFDAVQHLDWAVDLGIKVVFLWIFWSIYRRSKQYQAFLLHLRFFNSVWNSLACKTIATSKVQLVWNRCVTRCPRSLIKHVLLQFFWQFVSRHADIMFWCTDYGLSRRWCWCFVNLNVLTYRYSMLQVRILNWNSRAFLRWKWLRRSVLPAWELWRKYAIGRLWTVI